MYWVMVVVVAFVVFGVAAVAAGQGGAMAPAYPDRPDLALPPGPLGPGDLAGLRFAVGFRGYRMDEVDRVLDRVITELGAKEARIAELERAAYGLPAQLQDEPTAQLWTGDTYERPPGEGGTGGEPGGTDRRWDSGEG